ncbi:Ankyrin repeat and MYND domain-containing protein 2 [Chionoecetes opilio]|uniref:Ankyrin repeat and MYND domain-containing protein 2 n=1 Tax=Chionoecetes opilio TaxID=41210 RepID=A0A8J8WNK4_CHIOP|nr:Ankyrin repeat and MYND domain-containing protein 2 [Chionoecetes opilio]
MIVQQQQQHSPPSSHSFLHFSTAALPIMGADVNNDSHNHRYSPLHFAALSGNVEAVQHLLTAGARPYHTNTLGRTATQMAAFVGNHAVVALINNYVPMSHVTQYTQPSGLEKEAKLPPQAAKPLYDLIMQVNLHPVRIALSVGASALLQEHSNKAWRLLDHLCEKESKRSENVNEGATVIICSLDISQEVASEHGTGLPCSMTPPPRLLKHKKNIRK